MSSAHERSEGSEHPGKRRRVDEDSMPENEQAALIKSLEEENKAVAEKLKGVEECLELFQKSITLSFGKVIGGEAEYDRLKNALERTKAQIASLQLAPAQTAKEETRQQNVLMLVEKHNYRITIPITTHAQVMEHFQPLVTSGNKEHINHLLDFVFFAKIGKWCCFQEVCENGAVGFTEVRTGSGCPLHGAECNQVMMMRSEAVPHYQIIFKRFEPTCSSQ
jgi:hypothetical protein